jgi:hypothetical protein
MVTNLGQGQVGIQTGAAFASLEKLIASFASSPFPDRGDHDHGAAGTRVCLRFMADHVAGLHSRAAEPVYDQVDDENAPKRAGAHAATTYVQAVPSYAAPEYGDLPFPALSLSSRDLVKKTNGNRTYDEVYERAAAPGARSPARIVGGGQAADAATKMVPNIGRVQSRHSQAPSASRTVTPRSNAAVGSTPAMTPSQSTSRGLMAATGHRVTSYYEAPVDEDHVSGGAHVQGQPAVSAGAITSQRTSQQHHSSSFYHEYDVATDASSKNSNKSICPTAATRGREVTSAYEVPDDDDEDGSMRAPAVVPRASTSGYEAVGVIEYRNSVLPGQGVRVGGRGATTASAYEVPDDGEDEHPLPPLPPKPSYRHAVHGHASEPLPPLPARGKK